MVVLGTLEGEITRSQNERPDKSAQVMAVRCSVIATREEGSGGSTNDLLLAPLLPGHFSPTVLLCHGLFCKSFLSHLSCGP